MILALLGLLGLVASAGAAQPRYALVIANAGYAGSARLTNPVRDGQRLANTLRQLHFRVLERYDVDLNGMKTALRDFRTSLSPDSIALVYYSGHGVEVDGKNYLLPLGYNIATAEDVPDQAYPAERLMTQLAGSGTALNVLVLDACRDSPLPRASKGIGKGLAQISTQTSATLIHYATAAGRTAEDDSTYINALIAELPRPGRSILETFNAVGYDVSKATGGKQTPWMYVNNIPSIELVETGSAQPVTSVAASPPTRAIPPVEAPVPSSRTILGGDWTGSYAFEPSASRAAVSFKAHLLVTGNQVTGRIEEPNSFAKGAGATLYADVKGEIEGAQIHFTKTYMNAQNGAYNNSVDYAGSIDLRSGTISGVWMLASSNGLTRGKFTMQK